MLLASGLVLSGCSSAYKVSETPDDVYFSYGQQAARVETRQQQEEELYSSYFDGADDNYLRMKVQNRDKWNAIDDVDYWYGFNNPNTFMNPVQFNMGFNNWHGMNMWNNPFAFNNGFNMGWGWNTMGFNNIGMGWNHPFMFNNFYNSWNNPMCWNRPVVVVNKFPAGSGNARPYQPRPGLNSNAFNNSIFDRSNNNPGRSSNAQGGKPAGYGTGELFRSIFGSGNASGSGSSQGYSRPARYFDNSSSNFSSGGSSGGGSSRSSGGGASSGGASSGGGSRGGRGGN